MVGQANFMIVEIGQAPFAAFVSIAVVRKPKKSRG